MYDAPPPYPGIDPNVAAYPPSPQVNGHYPAPPAPAAGASAPYPDGPQNAAAGMSLLLQYDAIQYKIKPSVVQGTNRRLLHDVFK